MVWIGLGDFFNYKLHLVGSQGRWGWTLRGFVSEVCFMRFLATLKGVAALSKYLQFEHTAASTTILNNLTIIELEGFSFAHEYN